MIAYNVPGLSGIRLTRNILTAIYMGKIQRWNEDIIQNANMHIMLPDKKIIVLSRRDEAGVTETLTKGLSSFSQEWAEGPGIVSGLARGRARGAAVVGAPPETPGRLRRKNVAGGSAPRPSSKRVFGQSRNGV